MANSAGGIVFLSFWVLLALVQPVLPSEGSKPENLGESLYEGWLQVVDVDALIDHEGVVHHDPVRYTLRVEQGWLVVRHEVSDGEVDWEIVLARASDPAPPTV